MADLPTFARRIRRRAREIETNTDKLVALTAGVIDQTVVLATPVDTGRARGNWQVSIGSPITEAVDELSPGGSEAIATGKAVIRSRKPGQTIFISNNVAYIEALNEGSSSQAPANFVELAVLAGIRALNGQRIVRN